MGLDMYLTKRIYIGGNYEHNKVSGEINISKNGKPVKVDLSKVTYIEESAGYWRKANQIHKWFVENVQDGNDDCGSYDVSEEKLNELLSICKKIKSKCKLIDGKVVNGQTANRSTGMKLVDNIEDGKVMQNSHIAAKLLPSASGFFFGSTNYDQWYMQDIDGTIQIIEDILSEKQPDKDYLDFEISYHASW